MKGGRCSPAFHRICAGCALLPAALFVGTPTPPAPSAKDTRTLLPAPPPYPRLRQRIPVHSCRQPPPAPSALLPRPHRGAGSVRGDIRGAAVSGSSPGSPHAVDRGDIATGGEADGEGELVPPPLSPPLQPSYFSPATPTPPAPAALLPRPHRGRGPCVAIPGGQSCPALLQGLPMLWTVWISPRGVGPTGRGNLFPLPCLSCSNHLTSRWHPLPAPPAG